MTNSPKKLRAAKSKFDQNKLYSLEDAIKIVKKTSYSKFDGSIDMAFYLNIDVRQAEQQLKGSIALPNGFNKKIRILAITNNFEKAKKAGADMIASGAKLKEIFEAKKIAFDVIVTETENMKNLSQFGKKLGPKGLMPNLKKGTITENIEKTIKEIKKGKANYHTDKNGNIHTSIGKVSMDTKSLIENSMTVIELIKKIKPKAVKGKYIKKLSISSTMGPSVNVDMN